MGESVVGDVVVGDTVVGESVVGDDVVGDVVPTKGASQSLSDGRHSHPTPSFNGH